MVPFLTEKLKVLCICTLIPQLQNETVAIAQNVLVGEAWDTESVHSTMATALVTDQENKAHGEVLK